MGQPSAGLNARPLVPSGEIASEWYVRLTVVDRPGVMSDVTQVLAGRGISIESLVQKELGTPAGWAQIVMLTHEVSLGTIDQVLVRLRDLPCVQGEPVHFRVSSRED